MKPMLVQSRRTAVVFAADDNHSPIRSTADAKYSGVYGQFTHPMVGSFPFGMAAMESPAHPTSHFDNCR